jgi:hypothetical protein
MAQGAEVQGAADAGPQRRRDAERRGRRAQSAGGAEAGRGSSRSWLCSSGGDSIRGIRSLFFLMTSKSRQFVRLPVKAFVSGFGFGSIVGAVWETFVVFKLGK